MIISGRRNIAKHLALSWPTIKRLYREQDFPLVLVGCKWAIETDQVKQWLKDQYAEQRQKLDTT